jgi:GntR family transcriptional regulator, transcriptional repressor for pyruvate dehydrogenase complex
MAITLTQVPVKDLRRGMRTRELSQSIIGELRSKGLRPGDRLPTENEMAAMFGVSRPTLRQSLKILEFSGIIESVPRRGTVLKHADTRALAPLFAAHMAMSSTEADPGRETAALAEARWLIERSIAVLAAERRTAADLAALDDAIACFQEAVSRYDEHARLNADADFHRAYIASAHNPVLDSFINLIGGYFDTLTQHRPSVPKNVPLWLKEHRQTLADHLAIRNALESRDAGKVTRRVDLHLSKAAVVAKSRTSQRSKP